MGRETNRQRRAANDQSARARAAAMRIEQQRKERRRRAISVGAAVVAVLAVVAVIVVYGLHKSNSPVPAPKIGNLPGVTKDLQSVPSATLTSVGTGTGLISSGLPQTISDSPLTVNGKPDVLYIGAEFCPYCAAERWSLAVALSRFGTLSGLRSMHSSPTDTDPSTPTLTFRDASYASKYLSFSPVEDEDINHNPLQNPTSAQAALWKKYTYDPSTKSESFPFVDIGGKAIITGPTYDPAILKGLTQEQIGKDLSDPTSPVTKAIVGTANYITAAMCLATNNQPASACTASVKSLETKLPAFKGSGGTGSSSG